MENSSSFTSSTSTASTSNTSNSAAEKKAVLGVNTTVLARALFDNTAEVEQELTFSRGDVLTVLKKDPPGFEGWWICSLAGRVGIAPGNRLEILGSVNSKNKPPARKIPVAPNPLTTTVTALVNSPEPDPYDELPAIIEVPPAVPPHPQKMEQSFYANFYENYPSGGPPEGRNGSPYSQQHSLSSRSMSPRSDDIPAKSVSFAGTALTNTPTPPPAKHPSFDVNHKNNQAPQLNDNIPKRSVKRVGSTPIAHSNKPSVRFADPVPSEADTNIKSRDSVSKPTSNTVLATNETVTRESSLPRLGSWCGDQMDRQLTPEPKSPPESPVDLGNGADSSSLISPFTFKLTRSTSAPFALRQTRPATSFASWQQTHSRIELLITEALASMGRFEKGGSSQALLQKMRNFEQGLSAELSHLDRLCDTFNSGDSSINNFVLVERRKINKEREGPLVNAFQRLSQSNPEKGFPLMISSLEKISVSAQAIIDAVQENWLDSTDSEQSKRGTHLDDYLGSLSISDREDSITTSLDSNDPTDLAGLLHVYAAQFHSHSLLVRGTAEEFLGSLQTKINDPKNVRGYHLPAAGVLVANAKFLLRCSSQLVSLAANLSASLQNLPPSEVADSAEEVERLRGELEAHGNAVCESLKGLIAQTKDVSGCLTSPNLNFPTAITTLASKPIVILGPEMERLVGAIRNVVAATEALRLTVANSPVLRGSASLRIAEAD
ncbi:hypothetical protein Aperf_G00000087928 [Anoplocephala perfoliata]